MFDTQGIHTSRTMVIGVEKMEEKFSSKLKYLGFVCLGWVFLIIKTSLLSLMQHYFSFVFSLVED